VGLGPNARLDTTRHIEVDHNNLQSTQLVKRRQEEENPLGPVPDAKRQKPRHPCIPVTDDVTSMFGYIAERPTAEELDRFIETHGYIYDGDGVHRHLLVTVGRRRRRLSSIGWYTTGKLCEDNAARAAGLVFRH
jgi:hypothetical protein